MPDITNPPYPRPKKVLFSNNSFSFISCGDEVVASTEIFDWDGEEFIPTETGVYETLTHYVEVVDGVIDVVTPK